MSDTKQPQRLTDILPEIARLMGPGWTVKPKAEGNESDHWYGALSGPAGEQLSFGSNMHECKFSIRGSFEERDASGYHYWSLPYNKQTPSIGVADTKTPKAIVADIQRRLMPEYLPLLQENLERKASHEAHIAATRSTIEQLSKLVGAPVDANPAKHPEEVDIYHSRAFPEEIGDLKVSGTRVTFERFTVSVEEAEAMMRALMAQRAVK